MIQTLCLNFFNVLLFQNEIIKFILAGDIYFDEHIPKKRNFIIGIILASIIELLLSCFTSNISLFQIPFIFIFLILIYQRVNFIQWLEIFLIIGFLDGAILNIILSIANIAIDDYHLHIELRFLNLITTFVFLIIKYLKHKNKWFANLSLYSRIENTILCITLVLLNFFETAISLEMLDVFTEKYKQIGSILINLVYFFFFISIIRKNDSANRIHSLNNEIRQSSDFIDKQKQYYNDLLYRDDHAKRIRHDLKAHLTVISDLCNQNKYDELDEYLSSLKIDISTCSSVVQTGNDIVNFIVMDFCEKYPNINLNWEGKIPNDIAIKNYDLCTIFYNLIRNACQASSLTDNPYVFISLQIKEPAIIIEIKNSTKDTVLLDNAYNIIKKHSEGHGYGIRNVRTSVTNNMGVYEASYSNHEYLTRIIFPQAFSVNC